MPPPGRPRFSTRVKLIIAGGRRSRKGLGCLVFLLAVVAGLLAADYYHFNRPGGLICGHVGKSSYLFGMIPFGHDCEGMKALRYLDRARRALMKPSVVVRNFDGLMKLPGVGEPPEGTPYEFTLPGQDYLAADPIEPDSPHYHYLVAPDGTVYSEKDEEASPESPKLGSLGP